MFGMTTQFDRHITTAVAKRQPENHSLSLNSLPQV